MPCGAGGYGHVTYAGATYTAACGSSRTKSRQMTNPIDVQDVPLRTASPDAAVLSGCESVSQGSPETTVSRLRSGSNS